MAARRTVIVLSDIHYGGSAEKDRGWLEAEFIDNPALRLALRAYRQFIWRRDPFAHNYLLERFLGEVAEADFVVANGDFSCDTAFVGVGDEAAYQSADECLSRLRAKFGVRLQATIGDHELGKRSLFGDQGGMRLASWRRTTQGLGLESFWRRELGRYVMIGITSSLAALPVYLSETLPEERPEWERLREAHMGEIQSAINELKPHERLILFCHDPTALPFLWRETSIESKVRQLANTVIGHLHSRLFLWPSHLLAGMPSISALGYSIRRMSAALQEARYWKPFRIQLCPALAGIQLLKDGGYCSLELAEDTEEPVQWRVHPLPWGSQTKR